MFSSIQFTYMYQVVKSATDGARTTVSPNFLNFEFYRLYNIKYTATDNPTK